MSQFETTAPSSLAAAPTGEIAPTTEMDLYNAVTDSDTDGVVQVDHDQASFGNDTGSISLQLRRDLPQSVLPLNTDLSSNLPIHAYYASGAFGSAHDSVGTLRSQDLSGRDIAEDGTPWAYSLHTHVRGNLLLRDVANHVKRVEVIRPGGNAVVFDFAWDAAKGSFSPMGTPAGANQRDASRLYVLRDMTPADDADFSYELRFSSGITHVYTQTLGAATGTLTAVRDDRSAVTAAIPDTPDPFSTGTWAIDEDGFYTAALRYDVKLNFSAGQLASVDYRTKQVENGPEAETINTAISYGSNGGDVTALGKSNNGNYIDPFSYQVQSGGTTLVHAGTTVVRTGTVTAAGDVTFHVTSADASGFVESVISLNGDQQPMQQVDKLNDGTTTTTATTKWFYTSGQTGQRYDSNKAAKWANVEHVEYADGSWTSYSYDPTTGWINAILTPDHNSAYAAASPTATSGTLQTFTYLPDFGNPLTGAFRGDVADITRMTERPRQTTTQVNGVVVGSATAKYQGTTAIIKTGTQPGTSQSPGAPLTTIYTATRRDSYSLKTPTGITTVDGAAGTEAGSRNYTATEKFFNGAPTTSSTTVNRLGVGVASSRTGPGMPPISGTVSSSDAFGRPLTYSSPGMPDSSVNYGSAENTSWLGPVTVANADGSVVNSTYYDNGRVHTATTTLTLDDNGRSISIVKTYKYDAAGNVIQTDTAGSKYGSSGIELASTTTKATYDVRGRIVSSTDELNHTTSWTYTPSSAGTTITTTYPDQTTRIEQYRIDGSVASLSGTAEYPSATDHGVVTPNGGEYNADADHPVGSTWERSSTNGGQNKNVTYYDAAGRAYRVEQSVTVGAGTPGIAVSTTHYDGNGRVDRTVDFDGTVTLFSVDPATGLEDEIIDMNRNGVRDAGDRVSITRFVGGAKPGTVTKLLTPEGVVESAGVSFNGGRANEQTIAGQTSSSTVHYLANGRYEKISTAPDGTSTVRTYAAGLMISRETRGTDGIAITRLNFDYDAVGRLQSATDPAWTGTLSVQRRSDGTVSGFTYPDGRTETLTDFDEGTRKPQTLERPDGGVQHGWLNQRGRRESQSGAGILPSSFTYDPSSGQLSELTSYPSGGPSIEGSTTQSTLYYYDPRSGLPTGTFQDQWREHLEYNSQLQLDRADIGNEPVSFGYTNAGEISTAHFGSTLSAFELTLAVNEKSRDGLGRAKLITAEDKRPAGNGTAQFTLVNEYDASGRLKLDKSSRSGLSVHYDYYDNGPAGNAGVGAAGALKAIVLKKGLTDLQRTVYAYDANTKRLESITIEVAGQPNKVFTYGYRLGTNLVSTLTSNQVTFSTWGYESNTGRLTTRSTTSFVANGNAVYSSALQYDPTDKRHREDVDARDALTAELNHYSLTLDYDDADQLKDINVTGSGGPASDHWEYDGVGNRKNFKGGANPANNQYASDYYDNAGNLTGDAGTAYVYDSAGRLAWATLPNHGLKVEFLYDPAGRMIERHVRAWDGQKYGDPSVTKYVWDGAQLAAELDGADHLLLTYTWGPSGLLAIIDVPAGAIYYPTLDAQGSVIGLTDSAGNARANFIYSPFGVMTGSGTGPSAGVGNVRYAGSFYDPTLNLNLIDGNWYSPAQARYISRSGDNPINEYTFADNDPVNELVQTPTAPQRHYVEALPVPTDMPAPGPVLVNRDGEPPQMKTFMNYDAAQLDAMHLYHLDSGAVLTANMPFVGGRDQQLQKLGLDPAITVSAGITLSDGTPMTYYSDGTKSVFAMNPLAVSRRSYFSEAQYVNVKTIYFNNLQAISDYYKRTMTFVQVSGMVAEGVAGGGPLSTAATGAAAMRLGVRPKFGITASPPQQFVPNPGGRMGDAVTRAKTREVVEDLITRGFSRVRFEVEFKPGPFGSGKTRFADIVARNPVTGEAEIIQIGQTLRSNSRIPVMRERQALDDILFSPDLQKYPRNLIRFVDKNRPGVIQH